MHFSAAALQFCLVFCIMTFFFLSILPFKDYRLLIFKMFAIWTLKTWNNDIWYKSRCYMTFSKTSLTLNVNDKFINLYNIVLIIIFLTHWRILLLSAKKIKIMIVQGIDKSKESIHVFRRSPYWIFLKYNILLSLNFSCYK